MGITISAFFLRLMNVQNVSLLFKCERFDPRTMLGTNLMCVLDDLCDDAEAESLFCCDEPVAFIVRYLCELLF